MSQLFLKDYLELVDWAGRAMREGKRGAISEAMPPILQRLGLESSCYLEHLSGNAATEVSTAIGHFKRLRETADVLGKRFIKGVGMAFCWRRELYFLYYERWVSFALVVECNLTAT